MIKVAVVTGSRAEYGMLRPVIEKIKKSSKLRLQLIVTGMHLLEAHGHSIDEIKNDGFEISCTIGMYSEGLDIALYGRGLAKGIESFTSAFSRLKPGIVLIFGDRLEPFAAASAAMCLNIPIAHIAGGDSTLSGHIDEQIRHAITKMSHLHFTGTKKSAERIAKMGEEKWRITVSGSPSLDTIIGKKLAGRDEICTTLGLNPADKIVLCIQHPVIWQAAEAGRHMRETLEAIKGLGLQAAVIYPNSDYGSKGIIDEIRKYRRLPFIKAFRNMGSEDYLGLLKNADVIVGNSSSGIVEAPCFKVPAVNIGIRQKDREHSANIINVGHDSEEIAGAIRKALYSNVFRKKVKRCRSIYGDGRASERIVSVLEKTKMDNKLLLKRLTY